ATTRRQLVGFGWETRRDEPGRERTLQHVEQIKSRNGGRNWAAGPCVSQLVICACLMQMTSPGPPAINSPSAGRGAYAICALPDLCLRERGLLVRRGGDALRGILGQLGPGPA